MENFEKAVSINVTSCGVKYVPKKSVYTLLDEKHSLNKMTFGSKAYLTYDGGEERLSGSIGKFDIDTKVYSGGGRGHGDLAWALATKKMKGLNQAERAKKFENWKGDYLYEQHTSLSRLANTAENYNQKTGRYQQRGGTIPPGHYTCAMAINPNLGGECIELQPMPDANNPAYPFYGIAVKRNGFFIHVFGAKGSDGCLVFPQSEDGKRKKLNEAVKTFKGTVILEVINVGYQVPGIGFIRT